jgi:hypothetical protein
MDWDQAVAVSLFHQNSVPSVQMHRRITAILRAMATRASFDPMRRASRVPHALRGDQCWQSSSRMAVIVAHDRNESIRLRAASFGRRKRSAKW